MDIYYLLVTTFKHIGIKAIKKKIKSYLYMFTYTFKCHLRYLDDFSVGHVPSLCTFLKQKYNIVIVRGCDGTVLDEGGGISQSWMRWVQ